MSSNENETKDIKVSIKKFNGDTVIGIVITLKDEEIRFKQKKDPYLRLQDVMNDERKFIPFFKETEGIGSTFCLIHKDDIREIEEI